VHLAAADALGLSPITDSPLHHELILRKLARGASSTTSIEQFDDLSEALTQRAVFKIMGQILPAEKLQQLALQDVIEFRSRTEQLRRDFVADVGRIVGAEIEIGKIGETEKVVARVTNSLMEIARVYGSEMSATRDKLWPKLIEGVMAPATVATSSAGLVASYITGSGYVLAASVLLHALGPLKTGLEWRADWNKVHSARSAIAYLSKARALGRS
jgi:hypothetical protein